MNEFWCEKAINVFKIYHVHKHTLIMYVLIKKNIAVLA